MSPLTHVATSGNNVVRCCVDMLRAFDQAFISQDSLRSKDNIHYLLEEIMASPQDSNQSDLFQSRYVPPGFKPFS